MADETKAVEEPKVADPEPLDVEEPEDYTPEPEADEKQEPAKGEVDDSKETGADGDGAGEAEDAFELPEHLYEEAQLAGLTDADIEDLGSAEAVSRALAILDARAKAEPEKRDEPKAEPKPEPAEEEEFKLELGDEYDDGMKATFKRVVDHFSSKIKTVRQEADERVKRLEEAFQEQEFDRQVREFDGMVNALGDEYKDLLGKGARDAIDTRSAQYRNRCKLFEEMAAIEEGYRKKGLSNLTMGQLFRKALRSRFDVTQQPTGGKVKSKRSKIARPTHRKSAPLSPRQKAIKEMGEFIKERGLDEQADGDDTLLP